MVANLLIPNTNLREPTFSRFLDQGKLRRARLDTKAIADTSLG